MLNFFSLFNPFSQQYAALDNFQELSASKKLVICTITILATFISVPILGLGGVAAFRLATRKFCIIDLDQKQPINSHLAQAAVMANRYSILILKVLKNESINDSTLVEKDSFLSELEAWKQDSTVTDNKEEAYQYIKTAYENKNTYLRLNNLYLNELPKVIGQLTQLTELHLSDNQFHSLPVEIGQLTQLKELDLSHNQFQSLPVEIGQLTQLTGLSLSHNQFQSLPVEIGQLTQLTQLYLSHNQLQSLLVEIGLLTQLRRLHLDYNQLQSLPVETSQLTQLTDLYLCHNQLQSLPEEIGQLTQLTQLHLDYNQLQSLPVEIGQLTQLTQLHLDYNQLQSLPVEIGQLTQLTQLHLDYNQLQSLPVEISQLTQLIRLDLSHNQLQSLPVEIGQLTLLEWLDLNNLANLSDLPLNLGELESLLRLDITGTAISEASRDAILAQCRAKRNRSDLLIPRLQKWFALSKLDLNESKVADLSESAQETLKEWLRRLEQTRDYHQVQGRLASLVCQILDTVFSNSSFQEQFISQAEANNSCCEDRAAMALNEIYTSWKLLTLDSLSLREKLTTLIGVAKTSALRTCLLHLIDKQEKATSMPITESVEIFLYYETLLKKDLDLITAIDTMSYEQIGKREWIDTESLKKAVLTHYLSHLNEIPAFISLAQTESFLKEGYASINETFAKKIDDLGDAPHTSNNYDPLLLNWQSQIGEIKEEHKQACHELISEWTKQVMREV